MTKHYLLGQNAADFLKGQMANQTTEQLSGGWNAGRISGEVMPFEITGEWKKADGEEVYSCKAKQVWWNGERYVKDNTETAFEFTLYSPHDRDNQPSNAVGNTVFAVIRGNHWEVLGGGSSEILMGEVRTRISGVGAGLGDGAGTVWNIYRENGILTIDKNFFETNYVTVRGSSLKDNEYYPVGSIVLYQMTSTGYEVVEGRRSPTPALALALVSDTMVDNQMGLINQGADEVFLQNWENNNVFGAGIAAIEYSGVIPGNTRVQAYYQNIGDSYWQDVNARAVIRSAEVVLGEGYSILSIPKVTGTDMTTGENASPAQTITITAENATSSDYLRSGLTGQNTRPKPYSLQLQQENYWGVFRVARGATMTYVDPVNKILSSPVLVVARTPDRPFSNNTIWPIGQEDKLYNNNGFIPLIQVSDPVRAQVEGNEIAFTFWTDANELRNTWNLCSWDIVIQMTVRFTNQKLTGTDVSKRKQWSRTWRIFDKPNTAATRNRFEKLVLEEPGEYWVNYRIWARTANKFSDISLSESGSSVNNPNQIIRTRQLPAFTMDLYYDVAPKPEEPEEPES